MSGDRSVSGALEDARAPRYDVLDLSQPVTRAMARWRGTEETVIDTRVLAVDHGAPGVEISATHLQMWAHAGTHMDAPRHFFPTEPTIDVYPASRFVCRGVVLDVRRDGPVEVTAAELAAVDPGVRSGDAVLLWFGYAERYTSESYHDHPYLSADAAEWLVERRVNLVGVDTITPDQPAERRGPRFAFPVHTRLLGSDVLIIENLGPAIGELAGETFLLVVPPFRIEGSDASPVVPVALRDRSAGRDDGGAPA